MTGARIKQARLVAGLTLDEVAAQLSGLGCPISKQGLSNYEKDKRTPNPDILIKLANVFGVKSDYFISGPEPEVVLGSFRCQAGLRKTQQEEIKAMARDRVEKHVFLKDIFRASCTHFSKFTKIVRDVDDVEKAAVELRQSWELGSAPIRSLTRTIEDNGGIVIDHHFQNLKFDGLSGWANDTHPVVVVNVNAPVDRIRLSLAHEIGHLVMKCPNADEKTQEQFAFRFSGAFLLPKNVAYKELGEKRRNLLIHELKLLKKKYGMSMSSILYRAKDLGFISSQFHTGMMIYFRKNKWHIEEPVQIVRAEKPTLLRQMTLRALAEGIITESKAEELCPGCAASIEHTEKETLSPLNPRELMKLPKEKRERILARFAEFMDGEYRENSDLTDFDAHGEDDFIDG